MGCQLRRRMEQLEQTITDLGADIFVQKSQIANLRDEREQLVRLVKGVRCLLDNNGLISSDDFDAAVSLAEAESYGKENLEDPETSYAMQKLKSVSH